MVVTNDSHYPKHEDKLLQDVIILGNQFNKSGWHFYQDSFYMKDGDMWWNDFQKLGMEDQFSAEDFNTAIDNMHEIINKCKGAVIEKSPSIIEFDLKSHELYHDGDTKLSLIMRIINDVGRLNKTPKYMERLKYELKTIKDKGFLDYFLIQEDIIRWNRKQGYLVGPARGSSAGSLLAYYLDITKIDPLKYDLLFERFLDISRCLHPDTLCLVHQDNNFMYKKISDIKIGDMVKTNKSEKTVTKVIKSKHKKIIKINFDGQAILCSENHKWIVNRYGFETIVLAKDLRLSDKLIKF
jgi:DNA polymerase-3 subunit alpha